MGDLWRRFRAQSARSQWLSGVIAVVLVVGAIGLASSSPKSKTVVATPRSTSATAPTTTVAPARTVAPTTTRPIATTTTTRLPPRPGASLKITALGTSVANYVSILVNGQESQHSTVPLPATYQVSAPGLEGIVASAQNGSGQKGSSITCTINLHNGSPPVTKTAVGPYSIAQCNTNTK